MKEMKINLLKEVFKKFENERKEDAVNEIYGILGYVERPGHIVKRLIAYAVSEDEKIIHNLAEHASRYNDFTNRRTKFMTSVDLDYRFRCYDIPGINTVVESALSIMQCAKKTTDKSINGYLNEIFIEEIFNVVDYEVYDTSDVLIFRGTKKECLNYVKTHKKSVIDKTLPNVDVEHHCSVQGYPWTEFDKIIKNVPSAPADDVKKVRRFLHRMRK